MGKKDIGYGLFLGSFIGFIILIPDVVGLKISYHFLIPHIIMGGIGTILMLSKESTGKVN